MPTAKLEAQAGKLNLVIEQGATFNPVFTYTDENGTAINLTGYTSRMQIRTSHTAASFLDELTDGNGITLGGVAGTVTLLISAIDTAAYSFTDAVYDLELVSSGGIVTRLLQGSVILSTEATK